MDIQSDSLHIVKSRTKCISFFASLRLSGQLRWRDWCKLPNTILTISSPLLFKSDKSTVFMCSVEWRRLAGQGQESGGKVWGIKCAFDVCEWWPLSHQLVLPSYLVVLQTELYFISSEGFIKHNLSSIACVKIHYLHHVCSCGVSSAASIAQSLAIQTGHW